MAEIKRPESWKSASLKELKKIKGICLDIDETLSTKGKLTDEAYSALWDLKRAGFYVVPLTGRPAGWCDMIARFWPVDGVVGENGAFSLSMVKDKASPKAKATEKLVKRFTPGADPRTIERIQVLKSEILKAFPDAKWASDQAYREFDLAVDFCEDVAPWSESEINRLIAFCEAKKLHAKLSSIHLNIWFGDYNKLSGFKAWIQESGVKAPFDSWIFIGDSPNDEPLFQGFKQSVGVQNVRKFLPKISNPPTWITEKESGAGFAEMARRLISARKR